jgi:hypothetical protein
MTHVSQTSWLSGWIDMAERRVFNYYYSLDCCAAVYCVYSCAMSIRIRSRSIRLPLLGYDYSCCSRLLI